MVQCMEVVHDVMHCISLRSEASEASEATAADHLARVASAYLTGNLSRHIP
jgi:hypothetical protein